MPVLTCPSCGHAANVIDTAPPGAVYGCPKCRTPLPPVPERTPAWLTGPRAADLCYRVFLLLIMADYFLRFPKATTVFEQLVICGQATFFTLMVFALSHPPAQNPPMNAASGTKDQALRNS